MYARSSSLKTRHLPSSGVRKWHLVCNEKWGENLYPSQGEVSRGLEAPSFSAWRSESESFAFNHRCQCATREGGAEPVRGRRSRARRNLAPQFGAGGEGFARRRGRNLVRDALYRSVRGKPFVSGEGGEEGRQGRREGAATFVNFSLRGIRCLWSSVSEWIVLCTSRLILWANIVHLNCSDVKSVASCTEPGRGLHPAPGEWAVAAPGAPREFTAAGGQRPGPRIPRCHRKADVKRFARSFPSLPAQETKRKIGFLEKTAF